MKIQRLAIALTGVNLVLLVAFISQAGSAAPQRAAPILRGSALELVDDLGQIRARFNVQSDGEVILRLFDEKGTIRVKLGAGEDGSGLLLLDEVTEPAVQVIARRIGTSEKPTTTSITLRGEQGQQRILKP